MQKHTDSVCGGAKPRPSTPHWVVFTWGAKSHISLPIVCAALTSKREMDIQIIEY
jgi:hypothetical protein